MAEGGIRFGPYELDVDGYRLTRDGERVHLERIPMDLLILLGRANGRLMPREQIVEDLWGAHACIDAENALNTAIRKIRRALADEPECPKYLETVVGKGYRLRLGDSRTPAGAPAAAALEAGPRRMLVVLPFDDLSGDPAQEYFSDGLTEEVIARLGEIAPHRLGVIARTTSMAYKRTDKTVQRIGEELGTDYVLEGSVRREADRVRITAQLIRVADQTHVWARSFDRPLRGILEVQAEIGAAIAGQVQPNLAASGRAQEPARTAIDPQAYDDYLRGRFHLAKLTPPDLRRAIASFERASAREPAFAEAYSALAHCFIRLPIASDVRSADAHPRARAALARALELGDAAADAHAADAASRFWLEWDFDGAKRAARRAVELNANHEPGHFMLAHVSSNLGEHEEALASIRRALTLDPLSLIAHAMHGQFLYHAGRDEESAAQLLRTLELEPRFWVARICLAKTCERMGRLDLALEACSLAFECSGGNTEALSLAAHIHATAGRRTEAEQTIGRMLELRERRYVPPYNLALAYAGLDEAPQALGWLQAALDERDVHLVFLRDHKWDRLRPLGRFREIAEQVGLG